MSLAARKVLECLSNTSYMCLATCQAGDATSHPWAAPVYFSWDHDVNLYFLSMLSSRHMQGITPHGVVAGAIYASNQDTRGDVAGLQLRGVAHVLDTDETVAPAFENYFARALSLKYVKYGDEIDSPYAYHPDWKFVKLAPTELWLFDSHTFGDHRQNIPLTEVTSFLQP